MSKFATENTILEQRKLLPVYDVRDELLQVIRENQVVVIVGETGSGKTTQVHSIFSAAKLANMDAVNAKILDAGVEKCCSASSSAEMVVHASRILVWDVRKDVEAICML